jgi:hypothetical protein
MGCGDLPFRPASRDDLHFGADQAGTLRGSDIRRPHENGSAH